MSDTKQIWIATVADEHLAEHEVVVEIWQECGSWDSRIHNLHRSHDADGVSVTLVDRGFVTPVEALNSATAEINGADINTFLIGWRCTK